MLLKVIDTQLGVTATVAGCLRDRRQRGKVQHDVLELVRHWILGLVCGYADCNDAARRAGRVLEDACIEDAIAGCTVARHAAG